jgi:hypothetical protein
MADLQDYFDGSFDDGAIPASQGFDSTPIPNGEYMLKITKQELAATKDGTGIMLKMEYAVAEGEFENRRIWTNLNIRNKNAQAQAIAIGEFKALCLACGIEYETAKRDTDILNDIPFRANVGLEKPREGYDQRNRVTKYLPRDDAPAAPAAAAPKAPLPMMKAPPPKPAAGGKAMPWAKSA